MIDDNTITLHKGKWVKMYGKRNFLIGHVKIEDLNMPAAYISWVGVKEQFQNRGHGSSLLADAITIAKNKGCEGISLHCAVSNSKAIKFYNKHGFFIAAVTLKKSYSRETGKIEQHYFMAKNLIQ